MTSPSPILTFTGPTQTSSGYPSVGGFSGDANIVSDTNQGFYTYTKNAVGTSYLSNTYFWDQVSISSPLFTRTIYDRNLKRWFTVELDTNNILIAISNNMDYSKGSLYQTSVPVSITGNYFGEFINLASNNQYIIVTVDLVNVSTSVPKGTGIFIFPKQDLLNGNFDTMHAVYDLENNNICPILSYDTDDSTVYVAYSESSNLYLGSIVVTDVPIYNPRIATFSSSYRWNSVGGYAPQLNSPISLNLGDDRIQNGVIYNNKLWLVNSIFNPGLAQIMTWNIDFETLKLVSNLVISKTNTFLAYPYLALNKNGDVVVVYNEFNGHIYPSISYSYKDHTDNLFRSAVVLASGLSSFNSSSWGNYSAASLDSGDQQSFWLQAETTDDSNNWQILISKVLPITYVANANYDFFDLDQSQISTFTPATRTWNFNNFYEYQFGDPMTDTILASKVFSSAEDSLIVRSSNTFQIMPTLVQTFTSLFLQKGSSSDYPLSGDILGSGEAVLILFNAGNWNVFDIHNELNHTYNFGIDGDIPLLGDWLNLKRKQIGVWRPSNGIFYFLDVVTGKQGGFQYGVPYPSIYNDIPVVGDYMGLGYDQLGIYRSFNGVWFFQDYNNLNNNLAYQWGQAGDIPLEGQFSPGTNKTDIAVYRPSNNIFYIAGYENLQYGSSGDIPVPGSSVYYRMKALGLL